MLKEDRRQAIIEVLKKQNNVVSATTLAKQFQVSRQIIVQDIALLKVQNYPIISTARGYLLEKESRIQRIFEVYHYDHQIEKELQLIVDLGGEVVNVFVIHKTYGKIEATLPIKSRKDISDFLKQIEEGTSSPLKNITSNHHYHTVIADDEETLDLIEKELDKAGFLYH